MCTRRDSRGMEKFLRSFPLLVLAIALAMAGCSSDSPMSSSVPDSADERGVIRGVLNPGGVDFEFTSATNGDPENPIEGPFAIRGRNVRYEDGALLVDLSVANLGNNTYNEPVSLTFASIAPEGVTVLDPDGEESGPGAVISFQFENDDAMWTPGEESLSRATGFVVAAGTAIAFVAILDAGNGEDGKGSIGGMVWDDADGDSIMDTNEAGIEGAMLTLNAEGLVEMVTASAADGSYAFTGLDAGFYTVDKIAEEGVEITTGRPIYVALVESEGVVSSFLAANFGCKPDEGGGIATITGVVFDDTDGDGVRDDGEPGIGAAGIDIVGPNGLHGTGTTVGGSGAYTFLASGAGEYTVTSSPIDGMTATTPTAVTFTLAEGESKADVNFGYQSEGGGIATITGVVFDDTDGDGVRDDGEPGIGAAGIDIVGPNGLHGTGTTVGGSGAYTFLASGAGEYTVTSSPIDGMTATTPTAVTFTLAEGESKADVNFGYQSEGGGIATITGVVFDDTDGDGVRDDGEPGIGAAGIDIVGPNGLHGTGTTVGGSGAYTFLASGAGEYTVTSSPIDGMTATTPTAVTFTLAEGESKADVNFGYQSEGGGIATITGVVFDDTDGDGVRDDGEPGIGAAGIDIVGPNGLHGTGTTVGGSGAYTFLASGAGEYTVTSSPIDGMTATTPTAVTFTLAEGESKADVNFGYESEGGGIATITGVVFDDTDGDGVRDDGEPGIGAAGIDIVGPNGLHGTGTTVGGSGAYTFLASGAGEYTVTSSPIDGMTATTPTAVTFTLAEGESKADVNFGYEAEGGEATALYGIVFDDHNRNGEIDEGDDGIPGVRVRLCSKETSNSTHDKNCQSCRYRVTDHDGSYSFDDLDPGRYKLEAKRPKGFYAVTDRKLTIEIVDGQKTNVNFAFARKCNKNHDHSNDGDDGDDDDDDEVSDSVALPGGGNQGTSADK